MNICILHTNASPKQQKTKFIILASNLQCSQGELLNIKNQSTSLFLFVAHTRLIL